ncbi:MAG: hypothetical protein AB7U23_16670, partial [Dehalococcoidia bacterium]
MPDVFVGEERNAIVEQLLVEAFAEVEAGKGSRIVVLSAPPGRGKTRIVHEFCRRLAETQPQPPYWPATIMGDDARDTTELRGITEQRKWVYPRHWEQQGDARMPWFWWGISCQSRTNGELHEALHEHRDQLLEHGEGLTTSLTARGAVGFDVGSTVVDVLGVLGAVAPPLGIAVTVAGTAKTAWEHRDFFQRVLRRASERESASASRAREVGGSRREDEIGELADGLARLTKAMPTVLIVDDAHVADQALCDVLDSVLRRSESRLLVIATAWPAQLDREQDLLPFPRWARDFASKFATLTPVRYFRMDLQELTRDEVEQLLEAEMPAAAAFADLVHARLGANPHALRALLRLPRIRRAIERNELTASSLAQLDTAEDIYAEDWESVPESVRTALALAAQAPDLRYLPESVILALETRALVDEARRSVTEGANPYQWARKLDDSLHSFVEPMLRNVARRKAGGLIDDNDIAALHDAIVAAALNTDDPELSPAAREELLQQHVALVLDGHAPTGEEAAESALELAELHGARYAYARAIDLGQHALGWTTDEGVGLQARGLVAHSLGEA